jgi:N-acetylglucosamine kinase-like BadF-type ATPase
MAGATGMRSVVIGVDGGGTKTDVIVAALDGTVLASAQAGGANPEGVGTERMATVIAEVIDEALGTLSAERSDVAAAAFGLAGVDWDSDVEMVDAALATLGLPGPRTVVNDSQIALRAGCTQPWGIVSSIGTGTVTAGVNRDGRWFRTMAVGWGEPSGSWSMVANSLHAIAAHHHGTGPTTVLTELFLEALGQPNVVALFEGITRGRSHVGAHLAPLLDEAVARGDVVAADVLTTIAVQHGAMVVGVADRLKMTTDTFELVTSGGVHSAGGLFTAVFREHVAAACGAAQFTPLHVSPAVGAVSMAIESLGLTPVVL